jgi:hypothetical protein
VIRVRLQFQIENFTFQMKRKHAIDGVALCQASRSGTACRAPTVEVKHRGGGYLAFASGAE